MQVAVHEAQTIVSAIGRFGSPLFLYDESRLVADYASIREALPQAVRLYYSMKANPNPYLCITIHQLGSPIEVASIGEYRRAVSIGVPAEEIVFTGPGKSREEIRACIEGGIFCINAESVQELQVIQEEAQQLGVTVPVTLRVNLKTTRAGSRMASVGIPSQFGIDEDQLEDAIRTLLMKPQLQFIGLHTYQGTQNFHLDYYRESVPRMFDWVRQINRQFDLHLSTVGLGGGFGVPHFIGDEPFPIIEFGRIVAEELHKNEDLNLSHIFVESGRFITARMGCYISQVLYVKHSHGKRFAIIDGGTHHRAFSTVMGRSFKAHLPIRYILQDKKDTIMEEVSGAHDGHVPTNVVGKLCTPTDVVQSGVQLPKALDRGDLLIFPNSGAYGLSCGNVYFLSHTLPREIWLAPEGSLQDVSWLG